ncbi:peptidyl-prolyl cis-trans isomerase FKBP17-2, chloroplastic [Primulina eburnea]|uniref:peptidyl-prolyl cis-trans isomerase FKBP17-2, chloroplastic n=1 Tax=Primulina eburnea TaxID=1245227 RepID=UPI003C6BDA83
MASFFASPPFLSHPKTTNIYFSSSQTPTPNSSSSQPQTAAPPPPQPPQAAVVSPKPAAATKTNTAGSTDWIASTLTRRFGIGAGLAWAGFLAVGVVSEQIKTRFEVSQQQLNTRDVDKEEEVVFPNGIKYYDIRVGGGSSPRPGDLVVMNVKGSEQSTGQVFLDTFGNDINDRKRKKGPLALVMGSRPYSKGICEGIEYVLRSMNAGGKRRVIVPPSLGFGEEGAEFGEAVKIPPFATLEYVIELEKVSIAPS